MKKSLGFILLLGLVLRLWWLGTFPVALADDEMDYVITARSIWLSGKDTSGTWSPFSLRPKVNSSANPIAELPSLLTAPFAGIAYPSVFFVKLPYVLASMGTILMVYLIVSKLIGKKEALYSALVLTVNPWSIHFARTAYESPLALFFYLLAFYIILAVKKGKELFAIPFLALGFFCYHGAKITILPLTLAFLGIKFFSGRTINRKHAAILVVGVFILLGWFVSSFRNPEINSRMNAFAILHVDEGAPLVNLQRKMSIPSSVTSVFLNKYNELAQHVVFAYLGAFSTKFLFETGEYRPTFSFWYHGPLYIVDGLFLLFGFALLFCKKKNVWFGLLLLLFISIIPSAIYTGEYSYALRASLMFPVLAVFTGCGIYWFVGLFKRWKMLVIAGVCGLYLLSLANFLFLYFYRYPIYAGEGFFLSHRIVTSYAARVNKNGTPVTVLAKNARVFFEQYLFYSGLYTKDVVKTVQERMQSGDYSLGSVRFSDNCDNLEAQSGVLIISKDVSCFEKIRQENPDWSFVPDIVDGGELFTIHDDSLCSSVAKHPYPQITSKAPFAMERLSDNDFCTSWIMKR